MKSVERILSERIVLIVAMSVAVCAVHVSLYIKLIANNLKGTEKELLLYILTVTGFFIVFTIAKIILHPSSIMKEANKDKPKDNNR